MIYGRIYNNLLLFIDKLKRNIKNKIITALHILNFKKLTPSPIHLLEL